MGYATGMVNAFKDSVARNPNIPTIPAAAALGSDLPEFVTPNLREMSAPNAPLPLSGQP
jgi:hypothetical protein